MLVTHTQSRDAAVVRRIEAEYREMPGLVLTPEQAARLWAMPVGSALDALHTLVGTGFLSRNTFGGYRRT